MTTAKGGGDSFRAVLAAVSTEHKIGMLVVAGLFIAFALASSFLFPRYWPQFPGSRGLSAFIVVSIAFTVAMLLAVEFFAVEEEEAEAGDHPAAVEETQTAATETAQTTTEETTTEEATTTAAETEEATTTAAAEPQRIAVSGTEFAFALTPDDVKPGVVVFRLKNDGQIGHDLKIEGPGGVDAKTPVIDPGATAAVEVELQDGEYELYCTVPGHREGGMEVDLAVS
jgi:uncharacterized cupredoxin-like copper-binding protein